MARNREQLGMSKSHYFIINFMLFIFVGLDQNLNPICVYLKKI